MNEYQPPVRFEQLTPTSDEARGGEMVKKLAERVIKLLRKPGYLKESAAEVEIRPLDLTW